MDNVAGAVLVLLAALITAFGVHRAPELSALDEWTHIDYVWQVSNGQLPSAGSLIAPELLAEWSCRGQPNAVIPACGSGAPASEYPSRGENYNFWHPPLYYAVTAAITHVFAAVLPGEHSFISLARASGALWGAAAAVAMYAVLRQWGVRRSLTTAAAATLISVPTVAHAESIVTNDAPAPLAGVAALWVLTRVMVHGKTGWILPTLLTLVITATKTMNALAILAVAGVIGLSAIGTWRRGDRGLAWRLARIPTGVVLAVLTIFLAWDVLPTGQADPGWSSPVAGVNTARFDGLPFDEWLPTLAGGFSLVNNYWLQPALYSFAIPAAVGGLMVICTAAPFVGVVAFAKRMPARAVAWGSLAGSLAAPVLVQLNSLLDGLYFPGFNPRYAITLLPLALAVWALVSEERNFRVVPLSFAAAVVAATVLSFSGLVA